MPAHDLTADEPSRNRSPWNGNPPYMPDARPCGHPFGLNPRAGWRALRGREIYEHQLACFLGFDKCRERRASQFDSWLVVLQSPPRGHISRPALKPRPGRAFEAYRERIFVAVRVPDFQVTLRCNNGTEMKGHVKFAISKKLARQIFRLGRLPPEFRADQASRHAL